MSASGTIDSGFQELKATIVEDEYQIEDLLLSSPKVVSMRDLNSPRLPQGQAVKRPYKKRAGGPRGPYKKAKGGTLQGGEFLIYHEG
ncbi:MAG: hypothetical protein EOP45_03875 [Sphingobacteriaceae bacterium]|nr:MAG: hypothetical protein EOP45_03875 [Sphingobacteriaceae bacterium]